MPHCVYCCVSGCHNNTRIRKELSFFRFPSSKKRVQQWAENISRRDIISKEKPTTYRVCSVHFEPHMFINKRLNKSAVPTLHLPKRKDATTSTEPILPIQDLSIDLTSTTAASPQTSVAVTPKPDEVGEANSMEVNKHDQIDLNMPAVREVFSLQDTSGEQTLKSISETKANDDSSKDVMTTFQHQQKVIDARNFQLEADNFVMKFLLWQTALKNRFGKDKDGLRIYALNFYLTNPQLYQLLYTSSILPPPSAIRKTKIHFRPEVNSDLIALLSKRLKNNRHNYKFCTISIGEMSLKKNLYYDIGNDEIIGFHEINGVEGKELARYAFVLQLRGCAVDYRQPLGYAFMGTQNASSYDFLKEALKNWLLDTIRRLNDAGYTVTAIISEHTQILVDLADLLGVKVDRPYIAIDKARIYYIFDVSQLLQNIYTHLSMLQILQDEIKLPIWKYVEAFYNIDQQREVKLAPKLTAAHFKSTSSSKVSYARDVLSYAVAAGMSVEIELGNLPMDTKYVVNFILKFSQFLEILNSKIDTLSSAKNNQDCLKDFLEYLQNVKIIKVVDDDSTDITELFKGMQITINSILLLQNFCLLEGIKYNLIIKNSIGHFIRQIHKQSGIPREPTPIQFRRAFSKLVMKSLYKNTPSNVSVSEQDAILQFKSDLLFKTNIKTEKPALSVQTTDYRMDLPEKNGFIYFCGYLIRKISEKHYCTYFNHFMTYYEGYVRNNKLSKEFQAFSEGKKNGHHTVPSKRVVDFFKIFETIFFHLFDDSTNSISVVGIGRKLLNSYLSRYICFPCTCFPKEYAFKLFLRMRLYLTIKLSNRAIDRDDQNIPDYLVVNRLYSDDGDDW